MASNRNASAGKPEQPGRLRRWLDGLARPKGVRVDRGTPARVRLDDYSEALALAEAGELLLAEKVMALRGSGRKRIMVLGSGSGYPGRLAGYALQLAGRLGYGLVFLNVGESARPGQATEDMARHLRESFAARAAVEARPWLLAAVEQGVEAGHLVWFGDTATAVEEVCAKLHRVELILSGPGEVEDIRHKAPSAVFAVE